MCCHGSYMTVPSTWHDASVWVGSSRRHGISRGGRWGQSSVLFLPEGPTGIGFDLKYASCLFSISFCFTKTAIISCEIGTMDFIPF